jgi:hypothetical protein
MTSFIKSLFIKIKNIDIDDTECEYKSKCDPPNPDGHTCTKELDKSYCGIFRDFERGLR